MAEELPEGTVTILFTDVEASTDLTTRVGDERAREILRACDEVVRQQITRHRGQEVKHTGDGLMVAFTSARRAVACAVDIQRALAGRNRREPERTIRVRIGLNTGEVIREQEDLFGATVNAAKRITDHAAAGEILASETVRSVLGAATTVELEDRGEVKLKGFPQPLRLHRVSWEEEAIALAGLPLPERTPFVGREGERADLRRLLDEAVRSPGALVMIGGESGVGKTRLAEELLPEARRRGVLAWTGHCYEMEGTPPYIPFVEILEAAARMIPTAALRDALGDSAPEVARLMPELRRLFPDIPLPMELPLEQERRYLFNCVLEFLQRAAQRQPLLLMLEDLHWGDDSTLLLLQHIAQRLHEMPILIVGTYRDVELDVGHPLAAALRELTRQRLTHFVALKRLPEAGVEAMLQALSGRQPPVSLVQVVYRETEGNPFFVEEVFKHLAEEGKLFDAQGRWRSELGIGELEVPRSVSLVIGQRLERLSEECRRALTTAAVIGRAFSFELLEALGEVEVGALLEAIDEAERARLITSIADGPEARFIFVHELIRQTLVSGLSSPRRQRLHLRVAEAMERVYARALEEHASDLAHHYRSAGGLADPGHIVATSRAAGDLALRVKAYSEAKLHYTAALRAAAAPPGTPANERAQILHKLGQVHRGQGRWDESLGAYDQAIDLYRSVGLQTEVAAVLISKADAYTFRPLPQPLKALEALSAAGIGAPSDRYLRARIAELEAQNLVVLRRYAEADAARSEALALAQELGSGVLMARARIASGFYHLATLDVRHAVEDLSAVIEMDETTWYARMGAQSRCASALASMGRLDEAEERAAKAQQYFRQILEFPGEPEAKYLIGQRDPFEYGYSCVPTAMGALITGHFDEALEFTTRTLEESGDPPSIWVVMSLLPLMVALHYHLGRFEEAEELIQRFLVSPLGAQARLPSIVHAYRGLLQAAKGADSDSVVDSLAHVSLRFKPDIRSLPVHIVVAETGVLLRHAPLAEGQYEPLREVFQRGLLFTLPWVALLPRLLGAISILREQWSEAESYLEQAAEVAQSTQALPELALTHLELADLRSNLPGEASRSESQSHLEEARRLLSELGMVVWGRRVAAIEERLARPLARRRWPDGLTETEVTLLRLVAEGRSNQEIAQELSLSERTLQRRLSRLYKKITVGSRPAAITYAFRTGLIVEEEH